MVDWDKRYSDAEASGDLFGRAANNYVVQTLARADFEARSVICLADGTGRNGRYLAGQGLAVTAVDLSPVGTNIALQLDAKAGVTVERIVADLDEWVPGADQRWDAVFLIYLHCEREVRQHAIATAARHLNPGGWFVAEGFAAEFDEAGPRMGPSDPSLRYDIAEFDRWLESFELVESLTGLNRLQEGGRHQGLAPIVRYAARKI